MDTTIDDSGDTTTTQGDAPPVDPPADDAAPEEAAANKDAIISAEDARKLRIENRRVKETLREREEELARIQLSQMTDQERAVAEARAAVVAEYEAKMVESRLRERAAGKLANPADVTVFLDAAKFGSEVEDAELDDAIAQLLEERSYLRAADQRVPDIDQGPIRQQRRPKSFADMMNEQLGPRR